MITWPEIKRYVASQVGLVAAYLRTSHASADGQGDQVTVLGSGGKRVALPARRLQPFGLRSLAPNDCEAIGVRPGAAGALGLKLVILAAESGQYGPSDLQGGEVAIYDQQGSVIKLAQDGSLSITSKSGAKVVLDPAGNVVVNDGTLPVARKTDPVAPDSNFISLMALIVGVINSVAPGTVPPAMMTTFGAKMGTISGGAAKFNG